MKVDEPTKVHESLNNFQDQEKGARDHAPTRRQAGKPNCKNGKSEGEQKKLALVVTNMFKKRVGSKRYLCLQRVISYVIFFHYLSMTKTFPKNEWTDGPTVGQSNEWIIPLVEVRGSI